MEFFYSPICVKMDKLLNFAGLSFLKGKLEIIFASIFVYKVCSRFPKAGTNDESQDLQGRSSNWGPRTIHVVLVAVRSTWWVLEIWELLLMLCGLK